MNKKEIIAKISSETGYTASTVTDIVSTFIDEIISEVSKGEDVKLYPLGVFKTKVRSERTARNLQTNETIVLAPRRAVVFNPSTVLAKKVKEGL